MTVHQQHRHEHGGHEHEHEHGPLEAITHVHGGAPALNIGGDIGALVVLMDGITVGTELYVRSDRDPAVSVHTGVWNRDLGSGQVAAAVFCELESGAYSVLDANGVDVCSVGIAGGVLSEIDLRSQANPVI